MNGMSSSRISFFFFFFVRLRRIWPFVFNLFDLCCFLFRRHRCDLLLLLVFLIGSAFCFFYLGLFYFLCFGQLRFFFGGGGGGGPGQALDAVCPGMGFQAFVPLLPGTPVPGI